jgi:hypothetical protein
VPRPTRNRVVNAHRPLAPNALGQRYRARRYEPTAAADDENEPPEQPIGRDTYDHEPWAHCPCCGLLDADETRRILLRKERLDQVWAEIAQSPPRAMHFALRRAGLLHGDASTRSSTPAVLRAGALQHLLDTLVGDPLQLPTEPLTPSSGERERCRAIARLVGEDSPGLVGPDAAARVTFMRFIATLFLLKPLWVRPLEAWFPPPSPTTNWTASLAQHLLCRYQVPPFLAHGLECGSDKQLLWFALLAQGVGLRAAAGACRWRIPRRFEDALYQVPASSTFVTGLVWAEVIRHGGGRREFESLRAGYRGIDITDDTVPSIEWSFLTKAVRWLVHEGAVLTPEQCHQVVEWARHEHTEHARRGRELSWKRLTAVSALRRAAVYRDSLERAGHRDRSWPARGWDQAFEDAAGTSWSFEELTSSGALRLEGSAMQHCVAAYDVGCEKGYAAIVSVKRDGARVLTLEIDPAAHRLRQIRGEANRTASRDELAAVERWFSAIPRDQDM